MIKKVAAASTNSWYGAVTAETRRKGMKQSKIKGIVHLYKQKHSEKAVTQLNHHTNPPSHPSALKE